MDTITHHHLSNGSTRWGKYGIAEKYSLARTVSKNGDVLSAPIGNEGGTRPVFYLSSNAKIVDGDGTKANPYILKI